MEPMTILAVQKISDLLTANSALQQEITTMATSCNTTVPIIETRQIVLSSAPAEIENRDEQMTYPRICLYSSGFKSSDFQKFCLFSGTVSTVTDIWASGNFAAETDRWIHFYAGAYSTLLRRNTGDWGDGIFFGGLYDVLFQPPKIGGLGFVQMARIRFDLTITQE